MADILDEIMDDMKQQRWQLLWKKYGVLVAWLAVLLVVTVGAITWVKQSRKEAAEVSGALFYEIQALIGQKNTTLATEKLQQLAAEGSDGFAQLATLQQAALLYNNGAKDDAAALYEQLAGDKGASILVRDMAALLLARIQLEKGNFDEVLASVEPVAETDRPWRYLALEIKAIALHKKGEQQSAVDVLASIRDDGVAPNGSRERAVMLITHWQN